MVHVIKSANKEDQEQHITGMVKEKTQTNPLFCVTNVQMNIMITGMRCGMITMQGYYNNE